MALFSAFFLDDLTYDINPKYKINDENNSIENIYTDENESNIYSSPVDIKLVSYNNWFDMQNITKEIPNNVPTKWAKKYPNAYNPSNYPIVFNVIA